VSIVVSENEGRRGDGIEKGWHDEEERKGGRKWKE
jgi:hypothetical protein